MSSPRALALQAADRLGVFVLTGGGTGLANEVLTTAGASKTILEVTVPYSYAALTDYLGGAPEQAASQATARAMAMAAFQRAQTLLTHSAAGHRSRQRCFGLACTASLATDRVKRGTPRAHIALQLVGSSWDRLLELSPRHSRARQETMVVAGLWQLLADALSLHLPASAVPVAAATRSLAKPAWRRLMLGGENHTAAVGFQGQPEAPKLLLPGSFNPLHEGHRRMLRHAEQTLGLAGAFELSVANVDKPPLDYSTIKERIAPFQGRRSAGPLWLTHLPTFVEKARAFPGVTFAVGADTITRIGEPGYYGGAQGLAQALDELARLNTRFLVFGRATDQGYEDFKQLRLPKKLSQLCLGVPESDFRVDVSSTALRRKAQRG